MPFNLPLPQSLRQAGWKVKIREKETREPPHVTILCKNRAWRIDLRTGSFLDDEPDPADVPPLLLNHVREETNWKTICDEWDRKYRNNPVRGPEEQDED